VKYYPRDPDAFLSGVRGLNAEQIGIYALIIELLYARDCVLPDDDAAISSMLHLDPRTWRRVKAELMALNKIRQTTAGMLEANGVSSTLLRVKVQSKSAQHAANVRWENYRNAKKNNDPAMPSRTATKIKTIDYSSTSLEAQYAEPPQEVAEQFGDPVKFPKPLQVSRELEALIKHQNAERGIKPPPQTADLSGKSIGSAELKAALRAKGWIA
jgi:uncharacterized protein YdaU (DUF1376 family)